MLDHDWLHDPITYAMMFAIFAWAASVAEDVGRKVREIRERWRARRKE